MKTSGTAITPLDAEAVLIARARLGEEAAIRALVQNNNRRLYRVARAILGDEAEAEDVVQEAYLRAFRALAAFRGDSSFGTWLTRIAVNEALQRVRRRRRTRIGSGPRPPDLPGAEIIAFPGAQAADPERAAARRQLRDLVEAAVDLLPRPLRVVFILRDVEELSIAETASQLGLPPATVKTRLHRARRQLRTHLRDDIAASLSGTFPFGGTRCSHMADRVVGQLGAGSPCRAAAEAGAGADPHEDADVGRNETEETAMPQNPRTTARIAGHPIHPMLIPFPVAFLVATLACDLVYWWTRDPGWSTASVYLLGAALVMAALAAVAGLIDFLGERRIRQLSAAWHHMVGNVVVVLLSFWNWFRRQDAGEAAVLPFGLILSLIVVLLLLYTGWRGWEMVYKHRVAVADDRR